MTRTTVWIASGSSSGDSASALRRCSRIDRGVRAQRPLPWRTATASAARELSGDARVGDRVDVVAGDVGDREVDQARGRRRRRQPAALDRRDVLADRVDLDDPDPRREQELVQAALLVRRDPGRRQARERRAAAGEAGDHEVAVGRRLGDRQQAAGGGRARVARQRMVGAERVDPLQRCAAHEPRTAIAPPASRSPRIRSRATAIPIDALPAPTTSTRAGGVEPVADAVDDQLVAVQRDRLRGGAVDVAGREPRRRDPQPAAARLALAAVRERAVELERARPGRRGGGWRVGGQGLAQAATAGAASSAPG